MHYVTHRSHRMQKHKFGVMCPCVLLLGSALGPPKLEKCYVSDSCLRCTKTLYITHRSRRIQKHKFDVTCPYALLLGSAPGQPEHEN
jgi:hypothetical protein